MDGRHGKCRPSIFFAWFNLCMLTQLLEPSSYFEVKVGYSWLVASPHNQTHSHLLLRGKFLKQLTNLWNVYLDCGRKAECLEMTLTCMERLCKPVSVSLVLQTSLAIFRNCHWDSYYHFLWGQNEWKEFLLFNFSASSFNHRIEFGRT